MQVGDEGFQASYECVHGAAPPSPPNVVGAYVTPTVDHVATSAPGYETFRLQFLLGEGASNVYTIFGDPGLSAFLPPAYHVPAPFGVDIGGVDPAFFPIANNPALGYAAYDSWLTIGITEGNSRGAISSIGVDFGAWSDASGLEISNGAVFMMSPDDGPEGSVVVAQITSRIGVSRQMSVAAQGRSRGSADDWTEYGLTWNF